MKIRKTFQSNMTEGRVINAYSKSISDTYSCDYINNNGGGITLEDVYPIGAIYISAVNTNPKTLFKFGTWVQLQSRFLYATGAAEDTGGAQGKDNVSTLSGTSTESRKLTANQSGLRQHNHTYGQGYPNRAPDGSYHGTSADWGGAFNTNHQGPWDAADYHAHTVPYISVYVWQRTA